MGPGTFLLLLSTLVRTGFGCFYFKGLHFSDQRLVVRTEEREEYCVINKTTPYGSIVPCKGNATATRINDTHVLLRTPNDTDDYFTMEFGRDNEPGKSAESYRAASSCFYFNGNGSDLSDQTLVIRREVESNCVLNTTTTHAPCVGNATATRVNTTDILLKANDDLDVKFMEYGRVNETGKFAEPIAADCPNSPDLLEAEKSLDGHPLQPYIIGGAVVLTIILCLVAFILCGGQHWNLPGGKDPVMKT